MVETAKKTRDSWDKLDIILKFAGGVLTALTVALPASHKQPEKMILNLELLAYNFHDSLDLGPLFKDVYKQLDRNPPSKQNDQNIARLVKLTRDVIDKQVTMLVEGGAKLDGVINFDELKEKPAGV